VNLILASAALDAATASSGTTAFLVGALLVVLYVIRKLRTVMLFLVVLFAAFVASFVIMAVPQLHIEPLYSILLGFYQALPSYVGDTAGFFRRLMGAVG